MMIFTLELLKLNKAVSYCMKNDVEVWGNTNMAIKVG